jgi:ribosome modulation factor
MHPAQFKEGQEAYLGGRKKEDNPYPSGTLAYGQWNTGWEFQAKADLGEPE